MNSIMVKFGSIFKYKERDYIYLAQTDEVLYSARILDDKMSEELKRRCEYLQQHKSSPEMSKSLSHRIYCFVELRTEEVRGRLAHFAKTDENSPEECSLFSSGQLDTEDMRRIKEEIETGSVPVELKNLIKGIEFN